MQKLSGKTRILKPRDPVILRAKDAIGGWHALARGLGIKHSSVIGWPRIPAERVLAVEEITGIPRETLRPDIYPPEDRRRLRFTKTKS